MVVQHVLLVLITEKRKVHFALNLNKICVYWEKGSVDRNIRLACSHEGFALETTLKSTVISVSIWRDANFILNEIMCYGKQAKLDLITKFWRTNSRINKLMKILKIINE